MPYKKLLPKSRDTRERLKWAAALLVEKMKKWNKKVHNLFVCNFYAFKLLFTACCSKTELQVAITLYQLSRH